MNRIFLGLSIHNHQPLGNFPWVFEEAYEHAYLPMLKALERHPMIQVSLHYSGCLIDWLNHEHPEFFSLLRSLVERGQVEIMGGGYYEPILPSIPDIDKYGQISKMSDFIEQKFGRPPSGIWLAERVWEPELAKAISSAGIEWTLVDDTAFKMVGKKDKDLFGYFNTEDQGHYLKVFPISKYLRYSIPWHQVESVVEYLRLNASEHEDKIAILGDDGEKFGVWPETYEHCWGKFWVEDFFKAIEDNAEWLNTIKLGEYADKYLPTGRIYLPCASYDEMMEWSLPAEESWEYTELKHRLAENESDEILRYMHSGFWRNFMVKYPEINRMHKKMLLVHEKVHRARSISESECGLDYLWKAQCNCPYWHGVFGGIYLSDIRAVTYNNLINAENCADNVLNKSTKGYICQYIDYDGDGKREVIAEGNNFNLYLSPAEGGTLFEWDIRRHAYNLLSTVSRKPEAYHKILKGNITQGELSSKENEISSIHDIVRMKDGHYTDILSYDELPRSSLIDHFFDSNVTRDSFENNSFRESGEFSGRPYEFRVVSKGKSTYIELQRLGYVRAESNPIECILKKTIVLSENAEGIQINYKFINKGDSTVETLFGNEWNINLLGGGHNESAYYRVEGRDIGDAHLDSRGEISDIHELFMGNKYLGIELRLSLDRPLTIWRFPVQSMSNSEGGIEKVYQCSCLVLLLPLRIKPGQEFGFQYRWNVER